MMMMMMNMMILMMMLVMMIYDNDESDDDDEYISTYRAGSRLPILGGGNRYVGETAGCVKRSINR